MQHFGLNETINHLVVPVCVGMTICLEASTRALEFKVDGQSMKGWLIKDMKDGG